MRFRFGKRIGLGRLTAEQRDVLERLARGKISVEEAERLLVGGPDTRESSASADDTGVEETSEAPSDETEDERRARELVERIAQEVDRD